jgi:hypothetical protein
MKRLHVLLVLAIAASVVVPGGARAVGGFSVGAAVADMTPPPFDPAHHTPALDLPGFTGKRSWDFMEPYVDLSGDGEWNFPEPYLDLNHNLRYDGIYLAGGGRDPHPPTKIADPITARAFVVDNGSKKIAVEVLDTIGTFSDDLDRIRAAVRAKLGDHALDEIFISSTHDESAPDVIGLWGPGATPLGSGILNAGVNDYWMSFALERAAQAIVDAYNAREPATIRFAETTQPDDFLTCWSSYPYVRASKIPIMQATASSDGHTIVTLMNYGIHAETLSFNGGTPELDAQKYWLSADWPYWARTALEAHYGGVAIHMAGTVGSVETPKVFPAGTVSPVPTGQYDPGHPAGCRTIFATTGDPVPLGYYDENEALGNGVAARVIAALSSAGEPSASNDLTFERRHFFVPLTNTLFLAAGVGQVFPRRPFYLDGVELPGATEALAEPVHTVESYHLPEPNLGGLEVRTEMVVYRIGDAQFVSTPGEEFPIGYVRGFQGPQDMPYPGEAMTDWVTPHMSGKYRFIEGLGEDMIGYLFPKANSVGVPGEHPVGDLEDLVGVGPGTGPDRFGCGHSDDSEAVSGVAGNVVSATAVSMLEAAGSSGDRVLTGRWVWPDGSLHRNPLGDGTLGCDDTTRSFAPAPGAPIGVEVNNGSSVETISIPGGAVAFIDYNGMPQGLAPTVDTRGVLLTDGSRIYVDVYPAFP